MNRPLRERLTALLLLHDGQTGKIPLLRSLVAQPNLYRINTIRFNFISPTISVVCQYTRMWENMGMEWDDGVEAKRSLETDIERWTTEIDQLEKNLVYSMPYKIRQTAALRSCVSNAKRELLRYQKFGKKES